MFFKLALRNVLRNRRRSFLTASAIFFAAMIVGLAQGWVNGMLELYMRGYINYQTGHVRITTKGFIEREQFMPVDEIVERADEIIDQVKEIDGVEHVRQRIRFAILLGHQEMTVEALGVGLNLQENQFELSRKIVAGQIRKSGIYIGEELAKKLGVKLGDELLLATKTSEGGLNGIKLSVNGLVRLGITMFDEKLFFISLEDAKRLLKIYKGCTEIFVFADKTDLTDSLAVKIKAVLPPDVTARTFKEQLGGFYTAMKNAKIVYAIIEALILFLASFVVINTMMMAVFERLSEIGTLKALGMSDRELFVNFTLEGAIIGGAGGTVGAIVGYFIIAVFSIEGINLQAALSSVKVPFEYIVRPELSIMALITAIGLSIIVPALSAMIPACWASRLLPAEALRKRI